MAASSIREAVGVFDDPDSLQKAADALLQAGFTRAQLSVLGSHDAVVKRLGHMYKNVDEVEDNPHVPTMGYASTSSVNESSERIRSAMASSSAWACMVVDGNPLRNLPLVNSPFTAFAVTNQFNMPSLIFAAPTMNVTWNQ